MYGMMIYWRENSKWRRRKLN